MVEVIAAVTDGAPDLDRSDLALDSEALNPAPAEHAFAVEWQDGQTFVLRNTGTAPVTVNAITNDPNGSFAGEIPFSLDPGCGQRFYEVLTMGSAHVDELVLDIADSDTPMIVPLRRR